MGTVYLARQESLQRDLAIKVLAPEFTRDREFVERFKREGLISSRLRHPNIVQVFDFSDQGDMYYIAMEYVGPTDLQAHLKANGGKLPLPEVGRLVAQVLAALECAHDTGVTHRDVKPANVLLTPEGDAVLTDFSIASMQEAQRLTQTGAMVGTPDYMAPEQFDAKKIDFRCDLYAVGVILYEMLTGIRPFRGDTVVQVMKAQLMHVPEAPHVVDPEIPSQVSDVVMKALAKEAEERFESAGAMRKALLEASGLGELLSVVTPSRVSFASSQEPLPPPTPVPVPEAQVEAPKRRRSATVDLIGEVGEDFSSSFNSVGWRNFSYRWLSRLLVLEAIWYGLTRLWAGFLPGKHVVPLTYLDFWMVGALLINVIVALLLLVRIIRRERLFRILLAGGSCALLWGFWGWQYTHLEDPQYRFGLHVKSYFQRLSKGTK